MRRVAQDPAELDYLRTQFGGHRRLLRRCIEQLTALTAVVVHLDTEGCADPLSVSFDDGPVVAWAPSHEQTLGARPAHQPIGWCGIAQGNGQLSVIAVQGAEIR